MGEIIKKQINNSAQKFNLVTLRMKLAKYMLPNPKKP